MDKMQMQSMNIIEHNIEKLSKVFPSCITEKINRNGKLIKSVNLEILLSLFLENSQNSGGGK